MGSLSPFSPSLSILMICVLPFFDFSLHAQLVPTSTRVFIIMPYPKPIFPSPIGSPPGDFSSDVPGAGPLNPPQLLYVFRCVPSPKVATHAGTQWFCCAPAISFVCRPHAKLHVFLVASAGPKAASPTSQCPSAFFSTHRSVTSCRVMPKKLLPTSPPPGITTLSIFGVHDPFTVRA
jgi:hypothetical protein